MNQSGVIAEILRQVSDSEVYSGYTLGGHGTMRSFDLLESRENAGGTTWEVIAVDWDASITPEFQKPYPEYPDWSENGTWHYGIPTYLIVEHNGEYVTRTFAFSEAADPASEDFWREVERVLSGQRSDVAVTVHHTSPAMFYDRETGEIYSVSTQPSQAAQ